MPSCFLEIFVYTFSFGALVTSLVQPALQPSGTVGAYRYKTPVSKSTTP
ncbi:MAG: hypothetical protein ACP5OK_03115 [Thermoprotei archaeon]